MLKNHVTEQLVDSWGEIINIINSNNYNKKINYDNYSNN